MWLLRKNSGHVSGRASDLQSQPMSGIEEEERQNELFHTETFPAAGGAMPLPRSPSPPPAAHRYSVNIDEELREEVRKKLLHIQRPVLNMMRQICGAANLEYHRIVKQEVTEEAVDFVFKKEKQKMIAEKVEERAQQWFEDACKANTIFEPEISIVEKFKIGVYLRLVKVSDRLYSLYVGMPDQPSLERTAIAVETDNMQEAAAKVYQYLVENNVFIANMEPDESQVSMTQAAELSKFNLSELRDIVENYVGVSPPNTYFVGVSPPNTYFVNLLKGVKREPRSGSEFVFAGADNTVRRHVRDFLAEFDVSEIDARVDAHIVEASQMVFDVLTSRGTEEPMRDANVVRAWMLSNDENATINGPRILFARLVANRYCLSSDLAPKQHYLVARFARLRQQAALLMVNLRRLHYKNNTFTLDTAIPRRSNAIY